MQRGVFFLKKRQAVVHDSQAGRHSPSRFGEGHRGGLSAHMEYVLSDAGQPYIEKVAEVRPVYPLNTPAPMLASPSGKVTEVSPLHLENALTPMLVNPPGKATEVSPVHS